MSFIRLLVICQLMLALVLSATPAGAQTKQSRTPVVPVDPCAPIGRTEDGKLVYSLKCERLPAPAPQAITAAPPPPPEPETVRSGLFGMSFERRPANGEPAPAANRPDNR
jgi:hypothetical protein